MSRDPHLSDLQKKCFELSLAIYRLTKLFPENEVLANQIKELANEITADVLIAGAGGGTIGVGIDLKIEKMIVYFQIAKEQSWTNPENFEALTKHYRWLKFYLRDYKEMVSPFFQAPRQVQSEPVSVYAGQKMAGLNTAANQAIQSGSPVYAEPRSSQDQTAQRVEPLKNRIEAKPKTVKLAPPKELNARQKKIVDFLKKKNEAKMADLQGVFKNEVTERTLRNDLKDLVSQKLIKSQGEFKTRKYFLK
jgi:hypothetical protein